MRATSTQIKSKGGTSNCQPSISINCKNYTNIKFDANLCIYITETEENILLISELCVRDALIFMVAIGIIKDIVVCWLLKIYDFQYSLRISYFWFIFGSGDGKI